MDNVATSAQPVIATCEDYNRAYSYYYPLLCDFAFSYLKRRELCEEVVDDVFVMLWEKRETVTHIKAFLYACTRNLSIDYLRKEKRSVERNSEPIEAEALLYGEEAYPALEEREFAGHVDSAIELLPKRCKLIFSMFLYNNLNCGEIAESLSLSKKTVQTQVYIAYDKLTERLKRVYGVA